MGRLWKADWDETREHFVKWWNRKGLIVSSWSPPPAARAHAEADAPGEPGTLEARWTDAAWRAKAARRQLSQTDFVLDCYPRADCNIGPGSLATFLGCEPHFAEDTVWYEPVITDDRLDAPLAFDPENRWWKTHEALLVENVRVADGNYLVGQPDLIENLDTLASLRGSEQLMFDMVERPEWVKRKVSEITAAWLEAFERIYRLIRDEDGGTTTSPFRIWGPGRVTKVQCDAAALISPEMFTEFVVPSLAEQCGWLDRSMYHLDGTQAIRHLDLLLGIEDLDAIEWTPQAGLPDGGSPEWYGLYRRILEGGKSLQAIGVKPSEVIPLINAVGAKGLYVSIRSLSAHEARELEEAIKPYRA